MAQKYIIPFIIVIIIMFFFLKSRSENQSSSSPGAAPSIHRDNENKAGSSETVPAGQTPSTTNDGHTETSQKVPLEITPEEKEKDESAVNEAFKEIPPIKKFEKPAEKGQPWTDANEIQLPRN